MRAMLLLLFMAGPVLADATRFDSVGEGAEQLVIYSSLDERLAQPLIEGFQSRNPGVAVVYHDLLTGEIDARIRAETDAGGPTADFAFSSAMDQQVKLANDGYARPVTVPESAEWPDWANWRDMAYAMTFEPAVLVYHKPSLIGPPPDSRSELVRYLRYHPDQVRGRIGTYDISRSAVGFLLLARDQDHFPDIWATIRQMGLAGLRQFATSEEILERVADGRLIFGYNILGSYAADWVRTHPDLGMVLPRDYTVVVSRVALVPRAAHAPELGARFLSFFMSREGQTILAERLRLPAVSLEVSDKNSARAMQAALGDQLRPVPVSPGLLVYLDQAKRRRLLAQWARVLSGE
ncbi:ABC transporter substrate-binding protein [Falsirhodobacter xinxiangensis]|uniref:ABC transporter substrate-binding protein n=1 Tax=Falsirhodobacter xinxiangensis TaxID=2530049 RepID=UPI0010A9C579|nr:ABC transporter substrate-binding protein [Rhodobacter xinxiangensis]